MKVLCFTGPRKYDEVTAPAATKALKAAIFRSITNGFDVFVGGMAYGMDLVFARMLIGLTSTTTAGSGYLFTGEGGFRELFPDIRFRAYVPCKDQELQRGWTDEHRELYYDLLDRADTVFMVNDYVDCTASAYFRRNEAMVDISQSMIAVHDTSLTKGGTHHAFTYACSKKLPILVIDPVTGREGWQK